MIESTLITYLGDVLDVPVYAEVPENPTDSFVVIDRTGGSRSNHVTGATFAVQSYGATLVDAASLNESVASAMENIVSLPEIGGVRITSPGYNFTDSRTKRYRYQMVADIFYVEV